MDEEHRRLKSCLERAKAGDAEAFGEVVKAYEAAVFRLALRICGDAAEAEDVAQEAFVRAFVALIRFDTERPFGPWILKIAANRAVSRLRARRPTTPLPEQEPSEPPAEDARLAAALEKLAPQDRAIIAMHYEGDVNLAEIARRLGIREGAAKVRLFRARERLLVLLEDQE